MVVAEAAAASRAEQQLSVDGRGAGRRRRGRRLCARHRMTVRDGGKPAEARTCKCSARSETPWRWRPAEISCKEVRAALSRARWHRRRAGATVGKYLRRSLHRICRQRRGCACTYDACGTGCTYGADEWASSPEVTASAARLRADGGGAQAGLPAESGADVRSKVGEGEEGRGEGCGQEGADGGQGGKGAERGRERSFPAAAPNMGVDTSELPPSLPPNISIIPPPLTALPP
eukprot:365351-Chlamydomonas_euryale.AAC.6